MPVNLAHPPCNVPPHRKFLQINFIEHKVHLILSNSLQAVPFSQQIHPVKIFADYTVWEILLSFDKDFSF